MKLQTKEENLDWMKGKEEVNVGIEGVELDIKCTPRSKKENEEEEYVSEAHNTEPDDVDENLPGTDNSRKRNKENTKWASGSAHQRIG